MANFVKHLNLVKTDGKHVIDVIFKAKENCFNRFSHGVFVF